MVLNCTLSRKERCMDGRSHTRVFLPEHEICRKNVEVPTILMAPMGPDGKSVLCVQWFGLTEEPLPQNVTIPEDSQFLFTILADPNDIAFFGEPEKFHVVFLGQVKNWLKKEAVQAMIDGPGQGDPNAWIVWFMNPQVGMDFGGRPASPAVKIALLGDPNCGIIVPRHYVNLEARDRAMAEHSAQFDEANAEFDKD
jgi:hypothetical protein